LKVLKIQKKVDLKTRPKVIIKNKNKKIKIGIEGSF
jgi:hypothetical protein